MYSKYYISSDGKSKMWFCKDDRSKSVLGVFHNKESAIDFANNMCQSRGDCLIVIHDGSTYYVELDD